jgi:hypothetical protein
MSMTTDEILEDVSGRWGEEGLGAYEKAIAFYIMNMQRQYYEIYANYFKHFDVVSFYMLWVLAYVWALLRWKGEDLPTGDPWWFFGTIEGESPMPKIGELDSYPLSISGVDWNFVPEGDYPMMVATYLHDISHAWKNDTTTFWSEEGQNAARYLFETCKQYLLRHGVAEGYSIG